MGTIFAEKSTAFYTFLRGPSVKSVSSKGLNWDGILVESYRGGPGERPQVVSSKYILGLWRNHPSYGEDAYGNPYVKFPGALTLIVPGVVPAVNVRNEMNLNLCALEPAFVDSVIDELDQPSAVELHYQTNFYDSTLRRLMVLLCTEAGEGGPSGKLYADHLAHALVMRLFVMPGITHPTSHAVPSILPRHILTRVVELMRTPGSNPDLNALAAESGYSRSHFLRLFRAATGNTPHNFVLRMRVEQAKVLMKSKCKSLIDVALECGFSSHPHLVKAFRRVEGMTPSEYRRNL